MKIAVIGASGKTGRELVREALSRGHRVVAVCRDPSAGKLDEFAGRDDVEVHGVPVVSDEAVLTDALSGCDGVVAILVSVRKLRATELVTSLVKATAANGVTRLSFTAGEVTAEHGEGEPLSLRQRIMRAVVPPLVELTPFSVKDMLAASTLIQRQTQWGWSILRAPTLRDTPAVGYRMCEISEVTGKDALSRRDYAACLLDSLDLPERYRRTLTVVGR